MYVSDTHAWVYYLLNKLPKNLNKVFSSVEAAESIMLVPTIVLNECIHLAENGKISLTYNCTVCKTKRATRQNNRCYCSVL